MDNQQNNLQKKQEEKSQQDIDRRFNTIIRKWGDFPSYHRTILKLIPVFIILAAIPITVRLSQMKQDYQSKAEINANQSLTNSISGENMPTGDIPGWHQVFTDDFTTDVSLGSFPTAVSNKWTAYPDGWKDTSKNGTYYSSKVVSIQNGVLNQFVHTENGIHLVSAISPKIPSVTKGLLYGRYVIRFRADSVAGYKTAWLLWPDSETWPRDGEIDFPEGNLNGNISGFMHKQNATSGSDQDAYSTNVNYSSWHTAIIEWMPGKLSFILDGKNIGTSTNRVPNTPMHWVIQTESALDGTIPSNTAAGKVEIDWVAIYIPSSASISPTPTSTSILNPTPVQQLTATPTTFSNSSPTPSPTPIALKVSSNIINNQTLSGKTNWIANVTQGSATSVMFMVDGVLKWTEAFAPYQFNGDPAGIFDTFTLTNGTHNLTITAKNSQSSSSYTAVVNINNATGTGLQGLYFSNKDLSGTSQYRLDPAINYDWGKLSPLQGIPSDDFSVRWSGYIVPKYSENYTFYANSDDGVRVWVNNVLIINQWTNHPATEYTGQIALSANTKYLIKIEYYDHQYNALMKLSWSSPSTIKAIIPQNQLYSN